MIRAITTLLLLGLLAAPLAAADVAHLLESSPPKYRHILWQMVEVEREGEVLGELSDDLQAHFLSDMGAAEVALITEGLEDDDVADILQQVPDRITREVLDAMDYQDRARLERVIKYPDDVAGGLMNPAGAQVLTTLLLGKECGVRVDDDTLLGSLRFFYRFAGRGTVPYGDHRGEGGLGSNGKDGMIAAAMQIAAGSQGDVTIYEKARQYLGMSMLTSYPVLVKGHGDEGRGDGIWRSIVTSYTLGDRPDQYRTAMDYVGGGR